MSDVEEGSEDDDDEDKAASSSQWRTNACSKKGGEDKGTSTTSQWWPSTIIASRKDDEDQAASTSSQWRPSQSNSMDDKDEAVPLSSPIQPCKDLSQEDFRQLIVDFAQWFDGFNLLGMLRVLFKDIMDDVHTLENANSAMDLLSHLVASGELSRRKLSLLCDTIKITKQFGFESTSMNQLPSFQNIKEREVSSFTKYRIKLVNLGKVLTKENIATLDGTYNFPLTKKYKDSWILILDLELQGKLSKDKMKSLIKVLKENGMELAKKSVIDDNSTDDEEVEGAASISKSKDHSEEDDKEKRQLSPDDKIRKYLCDQQVNTCSKANRFQPAIMHSRYRVDIAHMFTDLNLMKENQNKITDPKPVGLDEVLAIVKKTPACKLLIEGEGGIGKTTLLRYFSYRWANKIDKTFEGKIVFLVNIRDIEKSKGVLDLIVKEINLKNFNLITDLPAENPRLIEKFITNHDNEIVLLLDGLDELQSGVDNPKNLFTGRELKNCKVILASRPEHIDEFIHESNVVHVKVKGFNSEIIEKYIKKYFEYFKVPKLGESLINELELVEPFKGGKHRDVYSMCKNPMLLLMICIMWQEKQNLPTDKSVLFEEVFRSILNQYNKEKKDEKIDAFKDTPKPIIDAMLVIGRGLYESLKINQLYIERKNLRGNKDMVTLALKLGFVYKDEPHSKSSFKEIFTAPHKLLVEALVGFYLSKSSHQLGEEEWDNIRENNNLNVAREFAIGFLGSRADTFLNHWITNSVTHYHNLINLFRFVKMEHIIKVENALNDCLWNSNLSIKPRINEICTSLKKCLHHIHHKDKDANVMKLLRVINGLGTKILIECICNEKLSKEKGIMLAHILIAVPKQNELLREISIWDEDVIEHLNSECRKLNFNYDVTEYSMHDRSLTSSFLVHLFCNSPKLTTLNIIGSELDVVLDTVIDNLTRQRVRLELQMIMDFSTSTLTKISGCSLASLFAITPKLEALTLSSCSLSGVIINDMIKECIERGVNMECMRYLDISENDLSQMSGCSLALLFAITPKLKTLTLSNCSLSGVIINDMIKECIERGVKMECMEYLDIYGNDLSKISGCSLALLFAITPKLKNLHLQHCSLSGVIINDMIKECIERGVNMECMRTLDISENDLSKMSGCSLALLFAITPKLKTLNLSDCSLSGVIINDMIKECIKRGVKMECMEYLGIYGNDLSKISGCSLALLFAITPKLENLHLQDCSLSGVIINDMIKECIKRGVKMECMDYLNMDDNDLSKMNGCSLALLFAITPKLEILTLSSCSLSGVIINDMIKECIERGVNMECMRYLDISENDLSQMSGCSLALLFAITPKLETLTLRNCSLSGVIINDMIKECIERGVNMECMRTLDISENDLSQMSGCSFALLFAITPKLETLTLRNCSLSGVIINDMIKECIERGVNMECMRTLDISENDLGKMSGCSLALLFAITPKLKTLNLSDCSLSGVIINDTIKECIQRGVNMECMECLGMDDNDLSKMSGCSLTSLFAITPKLKTLNLSDCSLPGVIINDMIKECIKRGVNMECMRTLDISENDLSQMSGCSFALLFAITPKLETLTLRNCSLSGVIINDMIKECIERGVNMECMRTLDISENDLSQMSGCSFALLFAITPKLETLTLRNCSLSGVIINDMIKECIERGVNMECMRTLDISENDLGKMSGCSLALLFAITPKLKTLNLSDCSLSGVIINDTIKECIQRGVNMECMECLGMDDNDLR
ncbi:uncharacterized protein [Antedon mediterranea]|uniref:uncharacterized protein n=1 Tax=Antedon mediterranea TaxID=105859 RepID=UPI003AF7932C